MNLEELADHFEQVKMVGNGFSARCPAHADKSPSLRVAAGNTGWLVKCYTGCTFFDVVTAAGLQPLHFKYNSASNSGPQRSGDARSKLVELMEQKRRIPFKLDEIIDIAIKPDVRRLAEAGVANPEMAQMPVPDALRMHIVVMDTYVWNVIGGRFDEWGVDWVEAKRVLARLIWNTYAKERAVLT